MNAILKVKTEKLDSIYCGYNSTNHYWFIILSLVKFFIQVELVCILYYFR